MSLVVDAWGCAMPSLLRLGYGAGSGNSNSDNGKWVIDFHGVFYHRNTFGMEGGKEKGAFWRRPAIAEMYVG